VEALIQYLYEIEIDIDIFFIRFDLSWSNNLVAKNQCNVLLIELYTRKLQECLIFLENSIHICCHYKSILHY
jgi:hypothetical protein